MSGESLAIQGSTTPERSPSTFIRSGVRNVGRAFDAVIGVSTLFLLLAVVSAVPVLNLLSLGYLLASSSRVAQSGKIRAGFPGITWLARLGKIALSVWVLLLPIRFTYDLWRDAELIETASQRAGEIKAFLIGLIILTAIHLVWAILRGGLFRHFLWPAPLKFIRALADPATVMPDYPPVSHLFRSFVQLLKTGFFGFIGGVCWLGPGVGMMLISALSPNQGLSALGSLIGGALLGAAVLVLPYLQTKAAVSGRFADHFDLTGLRRQFQRAPLAFGLALIISLVLAVPLYLLKIELTPQEVAWLPNLLFVFSIFPARLAVGWACGRSLRHESKRIWCSRWLAFLASVPFIATYVLIVWLSQYFSWHGTYSLLEQHTFLIPAPLLGL